VGRLRSGWQEAGRGQAGCPACLRTAAKSEPRHRLVLRSEPTPPEQHRLRRLEALLHRVASVQEHPRAEPSRNWHCNRGNYKPFLPKLSTKKGIPPVEAQRRPAVARLRRAEEGRNFTRRLVRHSLGDLSGEAQRAKSEGGSLGGGGSGLAKRGCSTKKWQPPGVPPIACQSVWLVCSARFDKQTVAPPGRRSATFLCCTPKRARPGIPFDTPIGKGTMPP
jgi:hypothetical protein